ncbi:hypothetical protein BN1708_003434 [Verticillium longisporum]|uniref:TEA domain-containing protein n=1 Tax=Verticillium longisporum TaxID=100787 RepID=A0A0G4LGC4_VERLO|nr:hypothetical protein BN1708_003434 [Verticillium longisporum]
MEQPRPMMPSPVYGYEHPGSNTNTSSHGSHGRRPQHSLSRQPLRDTTGNAQHITNGLGSLSQAAAASSCRQVPTLGLFSPSLPPSIPTPVVPSQAGSIFRNGGMGMAGMAGMGMKTRAEHLRLARRSRQDINPIYFTPEFRPYRDKQDQKDPNEKQIWPRVLEDAFLDSLLIIPHMGRKKYSMQGKQFGRNMLISEYLWIAYCCSLQPGQKTEERKRKQVSSHIQVVKKMFEKHRCYHFFFVKDADKSEARLKDSNSEIASFKDNPVLIALSEGRLPDVRPNYEYFSQILAMDSMVVMRPKTCWIFVSSVDVTMDENTGEAFDRSGKALNADAYPHLEKNLNKESDSSLNRGLNSGSVLLHEYNRELAQKEAAAATEIDQEWETRFPSLHRSLEAATAENRWLDMLEMTVTLELHPRSNFPSGSELNGFVELNIAQPQLQNHRWKCITRLQRPEELCRPGDGEPLIVEQTSEVGVQYMHRPGCNGADSSRGAECDCRTRPRQDVRVPFPAAEWASILSNCASYLQEPIDAKIKSEGLSSEEAKAAEQAAIESERTTSELIQQIAMFQELWSAPPDGSADRRKWTRRGVILWKFRTVHAFDDKWNPIYEKPTSTSKGRKPTDTDGEETSSSGRRSNRGKRVYHPPGTTWRFLTALDPISPAHQQNVCVNPANNAIPSRDMIMAPTPGYAHHLTATMSENLNAAWDPSHLPGQLPSLSSSGSMGYLDSNFTGLATPPPTASLPPSYAPSFDGNHDHPSSQQTSQLDFLNAPCSSSIDSQSTLVADMGPTGADPYLSATAGINVTTNIGVSGYDEADCATLQAWDTTAFQGLDQWSGWDSNAEANKSAPAPQPQQQHWQGENQRSARANWSLDPNGSKDNSQLWNQQGWAQAVSAAAAVTGADGRTGWSSVDQRVLPSLDQISPLKSMAGRKRARSNSLDMENRENFPATAIQKLVHHGTGPAGYDDGSHAHHRWE